MTFQPCRQPDFVCRVECAGETTIIMVNATSVAEARKKLEDKGFTIKSIKTFLETWVTRAKTETREAIAAYARNGGVDYAFKAKIWGELKNYLQDAFSGRCAYCESSFRHVAFGDVEHFRPKKRVTDEDNVQIIDPGTNQPHTGYYWLAYQFTNLFPCCQRCNQARAKMNQFPVEEGTRAYNQGDLSKERPLLLNPYTAPAQPSLKFIPALGTVEGIDEVGKTSVRVYNLQREYLVEERREEQQNVRLRIKDAVNQEKPEALALLVQEARTGARKFAAAALAEIEDLLKKFGWPVPG